MKPISPHAPALSIRHHVILGLVAAVAVIACVTYPIYDADIWQHLRVGRAILESGSIPQVHLWSWPQYGKPDVLPSWLFRVLIATAWKWGGIHGLFAWRWLTALAVAAVAYATAHRMGARGATPWVVLVWCLLLYRGRSQMRPETLVLIVMSAQMLVLEWRRARQREGGGPHATWALVPLAVIWANVHLSYYVSLLLAGFYLLEEVIRALRRDKAARPARKPARKKTAAKKPAAKKAPAKKK